jgi:predicted PurR-regulated permease PerM
MAESEKVATDSVLSPIAKMSGQILLITAAAAVIIFALIHLRLVVLPVIAALFITAVLSPPAERLKSKGWPPLLAAWTVILIGFLVIGGLGALVAPAVGNELDQLGNDVRSGIDEVVEWLETGPFNLSQTQIDRYVDEASKNLRENRSQIVGGVVTGAVLVVEVIAGLLLTFILVFFFVKDGTKIGRWALKLFRTEHQAHAREVAVRSWSSLQAYIRGIALIALIDALLIGIALLVIRVPLVLPLMLITFIGGFFPLVGAFLAGLVASLVALVTNGPLDALLVAGAITIIQQIEGDVLQPIVLSRAVNLHPIAILLSLTAGAILGGIVGAFLAVPIAVTAVTVGTYVRSTRSGAQEPAVAAGD